MLFTFKTALTSPKPYNTLPADQYLSLLHKNKRKIHDGSFGIYLARKVVVKNQELYQPLIDIDGDPDLDGSDKIISAIHFAQATLKSFSDLGAAEYFKIIASGGTGFRALSNLLLNHQAYFAFIDWMRCEIPHLHDLKPSIETDIPHQVFAYKGDPLHSQKTLIDGHSTVVDKNMLGQDVFTLDDYRQITAGKPDFDEVISFIQWLIDGPVISDLKAIGPLGEQIEQYQRIASDFPVNPFSFIQARKNRVPIGLNEIQEMIREKGIVSMIEQRGGRGQAISFRGLPCPVCGKTSVNARAYPPGYKLYCFNINCDAHGGMPFHQWAGIESKRSKYKASKNGFDMSVPNQYVGIEDSRDLVSQELNIQGDCVIVMTPGVGKTETTLKNILTMMKGHITIYAAFNRDLQKEAYNKICELAGHKDGFYLLQPRETTCLRPSELKSVNVRGFSPSEILCTGCEHRVTVCEYYNQRREFGPGVYFVTLHMLEYLQNLITNPDLIILDENLKAGLLLEDSCTDLQIKSVFKIVEGTHSALLKHLLNIIQKTSTNLVESGSNAMIINARKITEANTQETTIVDLLARSMNKTEDEVMSILNSLSDTLKKQSRQRLYQREIDMKAINWLIGLCSRCTLSFIYINKNGAVEYNTKRITQLGYRNTPIKILDATGDASAYSALIGRKLKTVRADVVWNSRRVHIKINTSRKAMQFSKNPGLKKLLSEMLPYTKCQKIMVITYKRHKKQILDCLKEIDPSREFMGYHFNGPRGINTYKDCDAVLAIGLPYPNLDSAMQDACILFPDEKDSDKRMDWSEACMQWDFVQSIHRIRPVNKSNVDIILAANRWPSMIPEPDLIIDKSQTKNWKEIAINRLSPFVETFGFLNQDIGFLANVYVKSKDSIAKQFQGNLIKKFEAFINCYSEFKSEFKSSPFCYKKDFNSIGYSCFKDVDKSLINNGMKLILVLNNILNQNSLKFENLYHQIDNLLEKQSIEWVNDDLQLSNPNQWSELLIHFKKINPHFEKFKIKLPHARGNTIIGVGNPDRVKAFYDQITDLEIVGNINLDSYQVVDQSKCSIPSIPAGFLSIYIPDDEQIAFIGSGSEFISIQLDQESSSLKPLFEGLLKNTKTKIVTNNGKKLAGIFLSCKLPMFEIIDIVINEKLIANGEIEYRGLNLKSVFKRHNLSDGLERSMMVHKLMGVWGEQEKTIKSLGLENIFKLETRLIWTTAKIESAGIGIDVDALLEVHDALRDKIESLTTLLKKSIPEDISIDDRMKVKEHLNSTYSLSLAKLDEESIRTISNSDVRILCENLIKYWQAAREIKNIELYMSLTGHDDRVRDSINQLNTKTGRFYRLLQTVQKEGPMRSLFKANEGYKFVIADYSQQEARIIAGLSNDRAAIDIFKTGKDIYFETAKIIIGQHVVGQKYRNLGKELFLGLNNGQSAYSIFKELERLGFAYDLDDVQGMILRYNMAFQAIDAWRENIVSTALDDGVISTKMGRIRKISRDVNPNSLYNYPVQGAAADGFKIALINLDEQLADIDARVVHILHDEVIVEAKDDVLEDVTAIVKNCMENAFQDILLEVPMVVEPEVRKIWGE